MQKLIQVRRLSSLAVVGLTLSLGACAEGLPTSTPMQLGAATMAPKGYLQFCVRRPDQCGLDAPVARVSSSALQAAINREEWTNVLSIARPSAVAPQGTAPARTSARMMMAAQIGAPMSNMEPVREITDLGSVGNARPFAVEPQPMLVQADNVTVASVAEATEAPTRPAPEAQGAAPSLDAMFRTVHRDAAPAALHYNPQLWAHLEKVNLDVNARIRPRTDEEAFGVDDYWTLPLDAGGRGEGNCKHYALEKRRQLIESGMAEDALSLAIVKTTDGQTHAVLLVATDRGDFVLDNLNPEIVGWRDTGYTWLSRQTPGAPLRWASIAERRGFGG